MSPRVTGQGPTSNTLAYTVLPPTPKTTAPTAQQPLLQQQQQNGLLRDSFSNSAQTTSSVVPGSQRQTRLAAAQQQMGQWLSRRYTMDDAAASTIIGTLRDAGLTQSAASTGLELVRTYQRVVDPLSYGTKGKEALQEDLRRLETLTKTAADQGSINLSTQRKMLGQINQWKKEFAPATPEQIKQSKAKAEAVRTANVNSREMQPYRQMLDDLKYLRDSFAARGGVSLGAGGLQHNAAKILISRIPAMEKAINSGDVGAVRKFVENNLGDRPKNQSIRAWADQLTRSDQKHKALFDSAHTIVEQFGPVAYTASKILSNVMKAQREGKPMSTAAYNTVVDLASYAVGKKYTGEVKDLVQKTVLEFARNVATDFAKDPTPAGLGKALTNGFKSAVLGVVGSAVKSLSPEQKAELYKAIYDMGSKLFDTNVIKPAIDRAFAP